ncbi:hypothetical protein PO909_024443 [Leuciscus waleckii]
MEIILENMRPLGEKVWRQTMVLFTWGGSLGNKPIEYHIESEGDALVGLVEMCGNRYHVFESMREDRTQVNQLLEKIEEMIMESALLESNDEHQGKKKKSQERETLSEWLRVEDIKKLLNEEWERSEMKEMVKIMSLQRFVRRGESLDLSLDFSGEVKNTESFINKLQLKDALEREWNRREAVDMARIQYRLKYLDANAEMSSCADEEDIQMSLAKVHDWCQKLPLSDYGSISSYEEHDKTEQDRD